MDLTVHVPDELASRLSASAGELSRRALEAWGLEEYKSGHITKAELRSLLGYETRERLDGFLKQNGVYSDYSLEDFEEDERTLRRLGMQ